jgi:hypothetical protein
MPNSTDADGDESTRRKRARTDAILDGPISGGTDVRPPPNYAIRQSPGPLVALHEHATELETPANSVYYAVADRSTFSIAGVMERDAAAESSPNSMLMPQDDPVGLGILSMDESSSLFEQ